MGRTGNKGADKCRAVRLGGEMGKVKAEYFSNLKILAFYEISTISKNTTQEGHWFSYI